MTDHVCYTPGTMRELDVLRGFGCFGEATKKQKEFAGKLGLDLAGVPLNVAEAMVEYEVRTGFYGKKVKQATQKQIEFGKKYNWDFSCMPCTIASEYIKNILWELSFLIIEQQQLEPGVWTVNIHNNERRQISCIDKNGLVRFTDMQRPYRYARSLLRCAAPEGSAPVFPLSPLAELTHEELLSRLMECILHETETQE